MDTFTRPQRNWVEIFFFHSLSVCFARKVWWNNPNLNICSLCNALPFVYHFSTKKKEKTFIAFHFSWDTFQLFSFIPLVDCISGGFFSLLSLCVCVENSRNIHPNERNKLSNAKQIENEKLKCIWRRLGKCGKWKDNIRIAMKWILYAWNGIVSNDRRERTRMECNNTN